MSQSDVKAPREFKFVGGPSRKRRRRTCPKAVPATPATPKPSAPRSSNNLENEPTILKSPADSTPVLEAPLETDSAHIEITLGPEPLNSPGLLSPSTSAAISRFQDSIDWSSGSFMNPFIDPGPTFSGSFDAVNRQFQLPFYFGPDLPFIQIGESSSTDHSPQDMMPGNAAQANDFEGRDSPVGDPSTPPPVDEIMLPSIQPTDASCNISSTITQLLNRCTSSCGPSFNFLGLS